MAATQDIEALEFERTALRAERDELVAALKAVRARMLLPAELEVQVNAVISKVEA